MSLISKLIIGAPVKGLKSASKGGSAKKNATEAFRGFKSDVTGAEVGTIEGQSTGDAILNGYHTTLKAVLDKTYREHALILSDAFTMGELVNNTPVPIVGFVYEHPSTLELLKYDYSEYPFLNKTTITNSYTKQNTRITIRSYRAITVENSVAVNIALNEAIYYGIEYYCDRGGTFKLLTMWGAFSNLVLESLQIIPPNGNETGGVGFEWHFRKIPFDTKNAESVVSKDIEKLSKGLVG